MKKDRTVPASSGPVLFLLFAGILRRWYLIRIGGDHESGHLLVFGFGVMPMLLKIMLRSVAVLCERWHHQITLHPIPVAPR